MTLTDVLGESPRSKVVRDARKQIPTGPRVRALLEGQRPDGGFGTHPYEKWTGAHWRLVSLVELGIGPEHAGALAASEVVLDWLCPNPESEWAPRMVNGRARIHASVEGNAVAACARLGRSGDPRVRALVERLLTTQWPDGGWNCDRSPSAHVSSFYET